MRRIGRWIFTSATALSLLLCLTTGALWTWTRTGHSSHARFARANAAVLSVHCQANSGHAFFMFVSAFAHPSLTSVALDPIAPADGVFVSPIGATNTHSCLGIEFQSHQAEVWLSLPRRGLRPAARSAHAVLLTLPFWLPTTVFALLPLTWLGRRIRAQRKPRPGACPNCGYNLTANISGICPECGTPVTSTHC